MKVSTKLSGAFAVLVVILAALLVYHVRTIRHVVLANYELAEISSRLYVSTSRQAGWINELEENAGKYWITRDTGYLQRYDEAYANFGAGIRELETTALGSAELQEIARLGELWAGFEAWGAAIDAPEHASEPPLAELRDRLWTLRLQSRRVGDASQAAMHARLEASAAAARHAERISWFAAAGTLLLSVLVFTAIVRSISRSLNRLQHGTREVARGNFEYRLDTARNDEFARLARDFNTMTRRLEELDRAQRDFLSKVSHDLKTPLASMRETVQVMLDGLTGPLTDRQRRLLELTNDSAVRLSGMIIKLLDLSAMEAGGVQLELASHDLDSLIRPAVAAVELGEPLSGSRVELDLPRQPVRVECDHDRVVQLVANLLENAVKYSPADAPILVRARLVDGPADGRGGSVPPEQWNRLGRRQDGSAALLLEVEDRGPGVPDGDKTRIFEHFFQAQGNRAPGQGVGLGLAICREIVDLHGGVVWVRDAAAGGSVFAVLMPGATPLVAPPAEAVPALQGQMQ